LQYCISVYYLSYYHFYLIIFPPIHLLFNNLLLLYNNAIEMCSIISLTVVTGLSLTSVIVSAALAAKRDYNNVFLLINGFLNPSTA
jgi:hypothetical protein